LDQTPLHNAIYTIHQFIATYDSDAQLIKEDRTTSLTELKNMGQERAAKIIGKWRKQLSRKVNIDNPSASKTADQEKHKTLNECCELLDNHIRNTQ